MEDKKIDNASSNEKEVVPPTAVSEEINKTQAIKLQEITQKLRLNKNKTILILSLVFIFLLLTIGLYFFSKTEFKKRSTDSRNKATKQIPQSSALPSSTATPATVVKPIYTGEDYVVFAHYNLGYTIEYPATNIDTHLVGATGGNFTQKYNDEDSILIYDIHPERNTISEVTIDNIIQQLTRCGEGGCSKFFEYKDYEKLQEKKIVELDGSDAYWIKTIIPEGSTNKVPPHVPIKAAVIERYVIPQNNRFLILELNYKDKIPEELSKAVDSFRLIPSIPASWIEYKKNDNSKISFKYPSEYIITENTQNKQIELQSPNDTVFLDYYDKSDELGKYFMNQTGHPFVDLESSHKAEQYLGNDVTNLKFSLNAFTYKQGGDNAIRVFNPSKQQNSVYFYVYGSPLVYRMTSAKNMEVVMNQILTSINELMRL